MKNGQITRIVLHPGPDESAFAKISAAFYGWAMTILCRLFGITLQDLGDLSKEARVRSTERGVVITTKDAESHSL